MIYIVGSDSHKNEKSDPDPHQSGKCSFFFYYISLNSFMPAMRMSPELIDEDDPANTSLKVHLHEIFYSGFLHRSIPYWSY
jgi:hypothetical protein